MRISRMKWCSKYTIDQQKWQLLATLSLGLLSRFVLANNVFLPFLDGAVFPF
jgi:hypothetical protein